jgi:hypothetical protein
METIMETFTLYGRTFKHGKCGELDVWDAIINKGNVAYYRIYKMKTESETKWVFYIRQKNKENEIMYHHNNTNVSTPPLTGWETSKKVRRILVYTIGNLNALEGSTNNTINLCILLSKLNTVYVHLLLTNNINNLFFSKKLLSIKNIKIHEPRHFYVSSINHTNYDTFINILDKQYNYKSIFIRTPLHLTQNLPLINKSVFFIQYSNSRNDKILNQVKNIFFSNKEVMDFYLEKYKNNTKKIIEIFPMVRSMGECSQTLDKNFINVINVCYLGSFKKEYLVKEYLDIFKNIHLKIKDIKICLYIFGDVYTKDSGLSKKMLLELSKTNNNIIYSGKINNEDVEKNLKNMHFGLSVRNDKFNTHLDLSSKLIDYSRNGVIPICNKTRINQYILGENFNGYVKTPDDIVDKLQAYIQNINLYNIDKEISISGSKKLLHENYIPVLENYINTL